MLFSADYFDKYQVLFIKFHYRHLPSFWTLKDYKRIVDSKSQDYMISLT